MKIPPTPRQKKALDFIRAYIKENEYSPSYDEIKNALGLKSKSGGHRLVLGLINRGHLGKVGGCHRSLFLIEATEEIE